LQLQDVAVLKKDVDRWKEEVKVQEAKACVAASRLKTEVDGHRETREHLDKTVQHLAETRQEIETTRKECADFMQRIRDDESQKERRTKVNEIEASAKLIIDAAAATELETLREKYRNVIEENNGLSVKIQKMEKERFEAEESLSRLKETVAGQKREISDLLAQVAEMEGLRLSLQREEERSSQQRAEVARLREEAAEMMEDMSSLRAKEADLLDFTQKLTDKNVTLQSDLAALEARSAVLESEHSRLAAAKGDAESELSQASVNLVEERRKRQDETEALARKLAERSTAADALARRVTDAENEVQVLKRKHAAGLRELKRELQATRKALDEKSGHGGHVSAPVASPPASRSSRTSSNTSLNRLEPMTGQELPASNGVPARTGGFGSLLAVPEPNGGLNTSPQTVRLRIFLAFIRFIIGIFMKVTQILLQRVLVPDSQTLIDKIVRLQRLMAKKQEKADFMEEHISTLLEEVKRKNRVIQHYVMTQAETGALSTNESDRNKVSLSTCSKHFFTHPFFHL